MDKTKYYILNPRGFANEYTIIKTNKNDSDRLEQFLKPSGYIRQIKHNEIDFKNIDYVYTLDNYISLNL